VGAVVSAHGPRIMSSSHLKLYTRFFATGPFLS
jgi:hypothetical protein